MLKIHCYRSIGLRRNILFFINHNTTVGTSRTFLVVKTRNCTPNSGMQNWYQDVLPCFSAAGLLKKLSEQLGLPYKKTKALSGYEMIRRIFIPGSRITTTDLLVNIQISKNFIKRLIKINLPIKIPQTFFYTFSPRLLSY